MSILVLDPGVQTTIQAAPRTGLRHAGVPASGPADSASMALANRLVGLAPGAPCLEVTYGAASFRFESAVQIGIAGAAVQIRIGGQDQPFHQTLSVAAGENVAIGPVRTGARVYLAVGGQLEAEEMLGSGSTYLPAGFGGHGGRALRKGDVLCLEPSGLAPEVATPAKLRLALSTSYALRAVAGPDYAGESGFDWAGTFVISPRLSRMGAEIEGIFPAQVGGLTPSSAVFPGTLQVTPKGKGFLLLADGQTTGGYPHLLQVIRADRHLLGQLRPGDRLQFLQTSQTRAEDALRAKQSLLQSWMPDFRL